MKNILIGNGINIQFSNNEYCNNNIIRRALSNLYNNNYNPRLYPHEIGDWLFQLHSIYSNLLNGSYDKHAFTSYEQNSLNSFKKRYKHLGNNLLIDEIGFEDYFIIHEIFCRSEKKYFIKRHDKREFLRRLFLDSIYNAGKVQNIYENYSIKFKRFLNNYHLIFTTNYDMNIENFSTKKVLYLHGAFHIIDEIYNPKSFKNKLSNAPIKKTPIISGNEFAFSNALISHSGQSKIHKMLLHSQANNAISQFADGLDKNKININSWTDSDNITLKSFGEAIKLKSKNPNESFEEYYPIKEFKKLKDTIDIIGLSPNNDNHIFEMIDDNQTIKHVTFYYYTKQEIDTVKSLLKNRLNVKFKSVKEFWENMND